LDSGLAVSSRKEWHTGKRAGKQKSALMNLFLNKERDIHCIASTNDICGEGAVWHPEESAVYWTDINRCLLHRYTISDTKVATWQFEQPVTAVTLTTDPDLLLIVLGGSIVLWHTKDCHRTDTIFELTSWPAIRCNDARVGPDGLLWFGTMQNNVRSDGSSKAITENVGELLSLDSNGKTQSWHTGIGITNTVAWSPEGERLLFGDTLSNCLYVSAFDKQRSIMAEPNIFSADFHRGLPDGSAVDSDGYLWNCRYGGHCIVRFAPDGSVTEVIEAPFQNPTTCAFGGDDLKTLYITSAAATGNNEKDLGGALFGMQVDVAGLPSHRFRL
jgi:sugar lactone lactonase YvrE